MAREMRPKVDPKFRDFLPPKGDEERTLLRKSIIEDGIRDPIVITEDGRIVDGHGRWEIAQELKLKVKTFVKEFKDDDAALDWMVSNQLARRNLTSEERSYFRGKKYLTMKQAEPFKTATVGHSVPPGDRASELIAESQGVSERTVRRDAKFAQGVDTLPAKQKTEVLAGKSDLTKKEIIAKAPIKCDKCTRLNMTVKDCPQCKAETESYKKKKFDKKPAKMKAGSMKFDWSAFRTDFGRVARAGDLIAKGYEEKKGPGTDHQKAYDLLNAYYTHMSAWEKRLTRAG